MDRKTCKACGKQLLLISSTNECQCGALYNCFGQRLAPVEQWGEETGERGLDFFNDTERSSCCDGIGCYQCQGGSVEDYR